MPLSLSLSTAAATAALLLLRGESAPVSITAANTLFGHAIKNGPLPPNTETTTFEHNCTSAPCTVTQLHVPSIYPGSGCPWDWERGLLRFYVDGALTLELTLLELAHVGAQGAVGNDPPQDGSPFGNDLFGKTAHTGGVYSTMRIPFQSTLRTTIQAAPSCATNSIYWFIIRGVEGLPVVLGGELALPDQAALTLYRNANVTLQPEEFLTVASAPPSTAGALVSMLFDATSGDYNYLEACVRFFPNGDPTPVFLSSGTEDMFEYNAAPRARLPRAPRPHPSTSVPTSRVSPLPFVAGSCPRRTTMRACSKRRRAA